MQLAAVAASALRTEVFRVTGDGTIESRALDTSVGDRAWTPWQPAPFPGEAVALAAISGWPAQIEVFALDRDGEVWNRWWWHQRGWTPSDTFNALGRPFADAGAVGLAALSAGDGYFNVFVEAVDGRTAVLPHLPAEGGATWRRCDAAAALGDGWWPAFEPHAAAAYRGPLDNATSRGPNSHQT